MLRRPYEKPSCASPDPSRYRNKLQETIKQYKLRDKEVGRGWPQEVSGFVGLNDWRLTNKWNVECEVWESSQADGQIADLEEDKTNNGYPASSIRYPVMNSQ
jgi:hypothetical protein